MAQISRPVIEIKDLNYLYNQGKTNEAKGLEDINLKIYPQEYVIIFGPSGCGKSTLLYTMAGFQKPSDGSVIVEGQDINAFGKKEKVNYHRTKIGMVFQSFFLVSTLKIIDNICLPKVFVGADPEERTKKAMEIMARFGIEKQADKFPVELSGGQRQRVAIARALMNDPDILIADEPVGNLDSKAAFNVMSILRELNERDKKTIILVTHDPTHLSFGSKVIHMSDGKIVKIDEVVERKEAILKGEDEVVVKKETVVPEVQMLMKSFQNFSPSQLGMLLIPFKAQEFISHIFFNVPEEHITKARNKLQEIISGRAKVEDFEKLLDTDEEKGGLGWDKRTVKKIVQRVSSILEQSEKIDMEKLDQTSMNLTEYLVNYFDLRLDNDTAREFTRMIRLRLDNKLSIVEFRKGLDRPRKDRGLAFNKHTALKVARELEVLLLAKYAS